MPDIRLITLSLIPMIGVKDNENLRIEFSLHIRRFLLLYNLRAFLVSASLMD